MKDSLTVCFPFSIPYVSFPFSVFSSGYSENFFQKSGECRTRIHIWEQFGPKKTLSLYHTNAEHHACSLLQLFLQLLFYILSTLQRHRYCLNPQVLTSGSLAYFFISSCFLSTSFFILRYIGRAATFHPTEFLIARDVPFLLLPCSCFLFLGQTHLFVLCTTQNYHFFLRRPKLSFEESFLQNELPFCYPYDIVIRLLSFCETVHQFWVFGYVNISNLNLVKIRAQNPFFRILRERQLTGNKYNIKGVSGKFYIFFEMFCIL